MAYLLARLATFRISASKLITLYWLKAASKWPRPLPQSPEALNALVRRVSVLNGYPSDEAARTAIATAILHLPMDKEGSVCTRATDGYFAALMSRSVVNQVAFSVVDAKRAQKLQDAAKAAGDEKTV